jgi:excisionase family DNA binding protein
MLDHVNFFVPRQEVQVPVLVKIREVANLLSVSRHTVHALITSGDLVASRVSPSDNKSRRHVRITRASLLRFYQKRFGHTLKAALENPFA